MGLSHEEQSFDRDTPYLYLISSATINIHDNARVPGALQNEDADSWYDDGDVPKTTAQTDVGKRGEIDMWGTWPRERATA